ncbi:hypothetical protein [Citrobacter meridianamericanus]|uniref:hypothetical protein n=1 Tax=Citrobacter meridianamericanus TaxID=2894201 RepID=UPI00351CDDB2|nr:hypothetical protein [Salmonella enterica]
MSHSPEYIKGAIAALNEVKAIGLAAAMHAGIIHGKETGNAVKTTVDSVADPLIDKYKAMVVKND